LQPHSNNIITEVTSRILTNGHRVHAKRSAAGVRGRVVGMKRWVSSPAILAFMAILGLFGGFALDGYAPVRYSSYVTLLSAEPAKLETQIRTILGPATLARIMEARHLYADALKSKPAAEVIEQFQKDITVRVSGDAEVRIAYVSDQASTGVGVLHDLVQALQAGGAPLTVSGDTGMRTEHPWKHRLPAAGLFCGFALGWVIRRAALGRAASASIAK
jgi:hypothetical protein